MQEPLFPTTVTQKLYNERAVLIGTFLGGPLVGGYLIAQNFKVLDEPAKVGRTWLVAILALVALLSTAAIPVFDKIPNMVYSFVICFAAHTVTKKSQGSRIALHQTAGGPLHSTWRAVLVGLIGCVLLVGAVLALSYLADQAV